MILGNDVSSWQRANPRTNGDVNFQKMKAAGSNFCFFRVYFGTWKDVDFDTYWVDSQGLVKRAGYYFPLTTFTIKEQTQLFINALKKEPGEMKPVVDVEQYKGTVPSGQMLKIAIPMIEDGLGKEPIIYTGKYVWRDMVQGSNDPYFAKYDLWLANYNNRPLIPSDIPAPWNKWVFWQFGEGKGRGYEFGVESKDIDMNWFNGDEAAFEAYCKTGSVPVVDPPIIIPSNGDFSLTTLSEMNVRSGPGTTFPVVGTIPANTVIVPIGISGNEVWVEVATDRWVCRSKNDTIYLA